MNDQLLTLQTPGQVLATGADKETRSQASDTRFLALGAAMLFAAAALLGAAIDHRFLQLAPPPPKVAFAEQGAVVLEAVLGQPGMKPEDSKRIVGDSLRAVLDKYQRAGYLVINITHSADGQLLVSAIPQGALDITAEMRASVARAVTRAASDPAAASDGHANR